MTKVDLTALNRLMDELNAQARKADEAHEGVVAHEYLIELSKMLGLVTMVSHESALLVTDILKTYNNASAEAQGLGGKKGLTDLLDLMSPRPTKN
jgi:hypothetical protein